MREAGIEQGMGQEQTSVMTLLAQSHRPRNAGSFSKLEKARKWILSWGVQEEDSCAETWPSGPGHPLASPGENEVLAPMARAAEQQVCHLLGTSSPARTGQSWTGPSPPDPTGTWGRSWAAGTLPGPQLHSSADSDLNATLSEPSLWGGQGLGEADASLSHGRRRGGKRHQGEHQQAGKRPGEDAGRGPRPGPGRSAALHTSP